MTSDALLTRLCEELPPRQQEAALLLTSGQPALTYPEAAGQMGVSLGTLYTHLKRIRDGHPELYALLMEARKKRLGARHALAVARAEAHSRQWHRKQANRRYYYRFGHWPWERVGRQASLRALAARIRSELKQFRL